MTLTQPSAGPNLAKSGLFGQLWIRGFARSPFPGWAANPPTRIRLRTPQSALQQLDWVSSRNGPTTAGNPLCGTKGLSVIRDRLDRHGSAGHGADPQTALPALGSGQIERHFPAPCAAQATCSLLGRIKKGYRTTRARGFSARDAESRRFPGFREKSPLATGWLWDSYSPATPGYNQMRSTTSLGRHAQQLIRQVGQCSVSGSGFQSTPPPLRLSQPIAPPKACADSHRT